MNDLATLLDQLRPLRIRGPADYAEQLIAEALGGKREISGVNKGYDVSTPKYGKIEVKCRQLPPMAGLKRGWL